MSLAILFHILCAQHVSYINISIIRILRLFCWITTLVVLFLVRCVLEFRCGWVGVVSVLRAEAQLVSCASACSTDTTPTQPHRNSNTHRTKNNTINVVIQQNSGKLLMMDILMSETCWAPKKWNKITRDIKLVFYSSAITMNDGRSNKHKFIYTFVIITFDFVLKVIVIFEGTLKVSVYYTLEVCLLCFLGRNRFYHPHNIGWGVQII